MPGVSRTMPPPSRTISSRCEVVWRPRWSSSRTSCVASSSSPARPFTIVDLPTPDEPTSTAVRFGSRKGRSSSRPSPVLAETASAGQAPSVTDLDLGEERRRLVDEVGLREQHDRLRPALPGHGQVALEAARVEVERQRLGEERDVDVRREHLLAGGLPHLLARDRGAPRKERLDERRLRGHADPVANGGQVTRPHQVVRRAGAQLAVLGREVVGAPVLNGDAGGAQPGGAMLGKRGFPAVVPPEPVQERVRDRKCQPKLLRLRVESGARPPAR